MGKKKMEMKRKESVAAIKLQSIQRGRIGRARHRKLSMFASTGASIFGEDGVIAEAKISEVSSGDKKSEDEPTGHETGSKSVFDKDGAIAEAKPSMGTSDDKKSEGKPYQYKEIEEKPRRSVSEELSEVSTTLINDAVRAAVVNSPTYSTSRKKASGSHSSIAKEDEDGLSLVNRLVTLGSEAVALGAEAVDKAYNNGETISGLLG